MRDFGRILMLNDHKNEPKLLGKGYDIRLYWTDAAWALGLCLYFGVCLELFYRMIVNYNDRYGSDMRYYAVTNVASGNSHDRFLGFLFQWLYDINKNTLEINIYLALVIALIVVANFAVMRFYIQHDGVYDKVPRYAVQAASLIAPFVGPIFVPHIHEHYYLNTFGAFCWHSPTQQSMILFSLIATLCFLKMFLKYEEGISPLWWILTMLMTSLSAFTKPSFYIGFALSIVILFLIELFAGGADNIGKRFGRLFVMGCTMLPAGVYMILLQTMEFGESTIEDEEHHLVFGIKVLLQQKNVPVKFLFGMAFSIIVLAVNYKKIKESKYLLGVLIFLTGAMQWAFVTETGKRANYGNFDWGKEYGSYFLAVICLALLIENICDKESVFAGDKKKRTVYFIIIGIVLALSVLSQMRYFNLILTGHGYRR